MEGLSVACMEFVRADPFLQTLRGDLTRAFGAVWSVKSFFWEMSLWLLLIWYWKGNNETNFSSFWQCIYDGSLLILTLPTGIRQSIFQTSKLLLEF